MITIEERVSRIEGILRFLATREDLAKLETRVVDWGSRMQMTGSPTEQDSDIFGIEDTNLTEIAGLAPMELDHLKRELTSEIHEMKDELKSDIKEVRLLLQTLVVALKDVKGFESMWFTANGERNTELGFPYDEEGFLS